MGSCASNNSIATSGCRIESLATRETKQFDQNPPQRDKPSAPEVVTVYHHSKKFFKTKASPFRYLVRVDKKPAKATPPAISETLNTSSLETRRVNRIDPVQSHPFNRRPAEQLHQHGTSMLPGQTMV